jgi:hypothetical protein
MFVFSPLLILRCTLSSPRSSRNGHQCHISISTFTNFDRISKPTIMSGIDHNGAHTPAGEQGDHSSITESAALQNTNNHEQGRTFHPFPRLPAELQHKIWHLALRPGDQAGVHRFSIVRREESDEAEGDQLRIEGGQVVGSRAGTRVRWARTFKSRTEEVLDVIHNGGELPPLCHCDQQGWKGIDYFFAAPKHPAPNTTLYSWRYPGNMSTYTWDMGLWQASADSRNIIRKHSRPEFWSRPMDELEEEHWEQGLDLELRPVLALADEGGETLPIKIHPDKDLFILDPEDFGPRVWVNDMLNDVSCMTHPELSTGPWKRLKNIALEYYSSWYDNEDSWSRKECFPDLIDHDKSAVGALARILKVMSYEISVGTSSVTAPFVWLIDRRLRAIPGQSWLSNQLYKQFHSIDGTTYIECDGINLDQQNTEKLTFPSATTFLSDFLGAAEPFINEPLEEWSPPMGWRMHENFGVLAGGEGYPRFGPEVTSYRYECYPWVNHSPIS